jgi:hypothetical protein
MVYFPEIGIERINQIRKKFDPTYTVIDPHLTILFPVPESIEQDWLLAHLRQVLEGWEPFPVRMNRLQKSWDHWLLLCAGDGELRMKQLYREIYTDRLAPYNREDIFIPHIGLGCFIHDLSLYDPVRPEELPWDEKRYAEALREAEHLQMDFQYQIDRLHFLRMKDDFSIIERVKAIQLG